MTHVPRHDRASRMAVLAALHLFLAKHPDLRIGQALVVVMGLDAMNKLWNVEDEQIVEAIAEWERKNP